MSIAVQSFKDALAHWASGVTVVTTHVDGRPVGITASSLTSVSLDPPQILICVARKLFTHQAIEQSGVFAVNILGTDHLEWGMRFAGMIPELSDRFAGIATHTAVTGAPILSDVLGWLDCRVRHAYDGGDHTIFVGEVMAAGSTEERSPLLYFNRSWRQLDAEPLQLPVAAR
ncbi:MAG TPA: flavin reductase family protein [Chloroflexi bacterium]|nr:flavin reductase family protein [Chloroflexota bacterium]